MPAKPRAEQVVNNCRRVARKPNSSGEKIQIVLTGLSGEDSVAELCRILAKFIRSD